MLTAPVTLSVFLIAADSVAAQTTPRSLIDRAVEAMGGAAAVRGLRNSTVEFNSVAFGLGQEETPESPARATFTTGRIVTDYSTGRRRFAQEVRLVSGAVSRITRIVTPSMGMTETNGQLAMDSWPAVQGAGRAIGVLPERVLLAALDRPEVLSLVRPRSWRGELADGVRYASGPDTLLLFFDRPTGRLLVTEAGADHPVLGDLRTVTWYTRWQDAGGVALPRQVDVEQNGRLVAHTVSTSAISNGSLDPELFVIPDSMTARAPGAGPPGPLVVTLVQLAPGLWRAEGGSHHSLVIEQPTGLVVVEAPQTAARVNAVLDTLRRRFPGKPVTAVVATHHHWDHSGGIRAVLARSLPVIAHARNGSFVRQIGAARKTIAPDRLSRGGAAPPVRGVTDSLALGSGPTRLVLYHLPSAHAEGILAAYHPASRIVFVSDVLSPAPTLPRAGAAELVAFARRYGLSIDRVAGGHGGVASWADVDRAAQGS